MIWVSLLQVLLGLAQSVARTVQQKQLLDAGEAKILAEQLALEKGRLERAIRARNSVSSDPDSLRDDPYRRD